MQLPSMLRTSAPEIEVEAGLASIAEVLSGAAPLDAQGPGVEGDEPSDEGSDPDEDTATEEEADEPAPEDGGCGSCAVGSRSISVPAVGLSLFLMSCLFARRRSR